MFFNSKFLKKLKHNLIIFIAILGPGLIAAIADNDAGGVATYTVAAAMYGTASRFFILIEMFLLGITQDVGARIALVTKKGLGDLVRENFGIKFSVVLFAFYFIVNQGVVLQNVSGLKSALMLFSFPWQISLLVFSLFIIFVIVKFDYARIQKIFLFLIVFYLAYVVSAFMVHPNWKDVFYNTVIWPKDTKIDLPFIFSRLAVLGTTITAWGQFFVHSYIVDKKLTKDHLNFERVEIWLGSILTTFISLMMVVAVSYTLYKHGIRAQDAYSAAIAIKPVAGDFAYMLFAAGLLGASILGLVIVPLATAYVFAELFGYEGSLDVEFKKGKFFYIFFSVQILSAYLISLIPQVNLFKITLFADFLNSAMLPVVFYLLIRFGESERLMGKYRVRGATSWFLRASAVFIGVIVIATTLAKVIGVY